jgi:hypothetical protein
MTEQASFSQQYLPLPLFFFNGFPHSGQLTIFEFSHQKRRGGDDVKPLRNLDNDARSTSAEKNKKL